MAISVCIETITPQKAIAYLETSERNRAISTRRVDKYVRSMREGRWYPISTVLVDDDGHMVDAHHRMKAVIKAGVPVQMVVVRGVPKEAIPVIDTGRPRSAGDMLAFIQQLDGVKSLMHKSTIARIVLSVRNGSFGSQVGNDEIADFMIYNIENVGLAYNDYVAMKKLGVTLGVGAATFMIREAFGQSERFGQFIKRVADGENIHQGMPEYACRNALLSGGKTGGKERQQRDFYLVLAAWSDVMDGVNRKLYRVPKGLTANDYLKLVKQHNNFGAIAG